MDMFNGTYFEENEKYKKIEFEKINLNEKISEIYYTAIEKAFQDYLEEIEQKRKHFLNISYTEDQAQERFNEFTNDILYKNENDDSIYRFFKNEVLKTYNNISTEDAQNIIIDCLSNYINDRIISFTEKLDFIKELPSQIYESNKIHRQFLFFKELAEKQIKSNSDINPINKTDNKNKIEVNNSKANRTDIAYYCYYTSETKTLILENDFPSSKAWDEIGIRFQRNAKNIQTLFNQIIYNKTERLKKTRIKNIEFVIENLLSDKPEAKKLAKEELKQAELNL